MSYPSDPPMGGPVPPSFPPQGPPGGFPPQGPPPGQPPAMPYQPGGSGAAQLGIGQSLSYGWEKFKQFPGQLIGLCVGMMLLSMLLVGVTFFLAMGVLSAVSSSVVSLLVFSVLGAVTFGVLMIFGAGLYRAGLAVTRGEEPSFSMLFDTAHIGPYIVTVLLMSLATAVGLVLCVIPGIAVAVLLAFAPLLVLEEGMAPMDALRTSFEMVKSRFWEVLAVLFVINIVAQLGSYVCGIGVLVTMPIALVAQVYAFRALRGEPAV